ncbi:cartilage matrix protein-like [Actinia tenebrosa]|uniref:Cartilage matrix protein-like n=1 Tax=Actinia tenebrosa TaxID=6105 RepID=A0A6P8HW70_ACTTE|nr:cartilage matrix protein-like [Actinia tenebrosa]
MVLRSVILMMLTSCVLSSTILEQCKEQHDIAFVLDSSRSMVEQGLVMAQSLALNVVNGFSVGEDKTRVGLITFSEESHIQFHFDTYYTKEEIYLAVTSHDGINFTSASIDKAYKAIELLFSSSFGSRPDVSRFVVFISNGLFTTTNMTSGLSGMLDRLKEMKVKILVAGVGIEVNKPRLEKVVDDKIKDVVTAEEFNAPMLIQRIRELTDEFCQMKMNPKD